MGACARTGELTVKPVNVCIHFYSAHCQPGVMDLHTQGEYPSVFVQWGA